MFQVNKDEEVSGLWFNEIRVTKALANKEYSLKNVETAALLCEKILDDDRNDLKYRIMLSKCQKQIFQDELSQKNQLIAKEKYPNSLLVLENEACRLFENFNFEESLKLYLKGDKLIKRPQHFKIGIAKLDHTYDSIFDLNYSKYKKNILGNTVEKFEQQNNLDTLVNSDDFYTRNNLTRKRYNLFYLKTLNDFQKHIGKILKYSTPMHPFKETETNIYSEMEILINAADMVEAQLYGRRAFYLYHCDVHPLRGERLVTQKVNLKIKEDMRHLQVVKYFDMIIGLILKNEIKEAKKKTELMIKYMKKERCDSQKVLNEIYRTFGIAQFLLFQNINKLNEKYNHQRILLLLGAIESSFIIQESLYGSYDVNLKGILDKLSERMKISKSIMEKIYLHFEMAKYYIKVKKLSEAQLNASYGLKLAEEARCQAWICNLSILTASIDFQLGDKAKCFIELKTARKIACAFKVPGVKNFLQKMIKIIPKVNALKSTSFERKKMDIIKFMPNKYKKKQAITMFKRLNTIDILECIYESDAEDE